MSKRRRQRPDAYELGAARMRAELEPYEPLPDALRRFDFRRLMFVVLIVLVVLAVVRSGGDRDVPAVDGSCTKPAFAFDRETARVGRLVTWSVAGPTGAQVTLVADGTTVVAGPVTLKDCKASGRFVVRLAAGEHVVRMVLRDSSGVRRTVGSRTLDVSSL